MTTILNGETYIKLLKGGAACLFDSIKTVNDLNVFPIPDGDTGDNMYSTISSGCSIQNTSTSLSEVSALAGRGMLHGAKGNSGAILSRIFYGLGKGFESVDEANIDTVKAAMKRAVDEAYGAVETPVEGTILSVFRDAVNFANSNNDDDLEKYLDDFIKEAKASLDRTPDFLPVLKDAGVVDSGGAGIVFIACGMKEAAEGKERSVGEVQSKAEAVDYSLFNEDSVLEYGYCTEFLLQLQNCKIDIQSFDINEYTNELRSLGDSIVAFADGSVVKTHIHTKNPGDVLNHVQKYGEFLKLKIENMTLQHSETKIENRYVAPTMKKKIGLVAVAAGDGIIGMFRELGADFVISGGQSINPSVDDFIKAYKETNAENIFVFPNNPNVIMVAEQSAELYTDSKIIVIKTKNLGEGYMGLSSVDTSSRDIEEITSAVYEGIEGVQTLCISKATKNAKSPYTDIIEGDFIGFEGKTVYSDGKTATEASLTLLDKIGAKDRDVILFIVGKEADREEAEKLKGEIENIYKRTEVIEIDGGQPIYDYVFILT